MTVEELIHQLELFSPELQVTILNEKEEAPRHISKVEGLVDRSILHPPRIYIHSGPLWVGIG